MRNIHIHLVVIQEIFLKMMNYAEKEECFGIFEHV